MAVQLLFCGVLFPGFVQDSTWYSCVAPIKLSLRTFCLHPSGNIDTTVAWKKPFYRIDWTSL